MDENITLVEKPATRFESNYTTQLQVQRAETSEQNLHLIKSFCLLFTPNSQVIF